MRKRFAFAALFAVGLLAGTACANPHQEISGPFKQPSDVTKKCLECHEKAASEVMKTTHWTWSSKEAVAGHEGKVLRGKKNSINNFCISITGNWPRCTSCHISYGWKDASFDFKDASNIDCLVCHDTTGTYKKPGPGAGMPAGYTGNEKFDKKPVDLLKVARNVGSPTRENCVGCHGFGGGGNNVKHGDISSAIKNPSRDVDVHMATDGLNFSCQECHTTQDHDIDGNAMVVSPGGKNHFTCTKCHEEKPHKKERLNKHVATVACQTCHIPYFAKKMPTKVYWDWSTAGKDLHPPDQVFGEEKRHAYAKKKGTFIWEQKVKPVYKWYNGKAGAYLWGQKIDDLTKVTELNYPVGDIKDMDAKIYPFKIHEGKQPYDAKNKHFLAPKVWPSGPDKEDAYWKSFDWDRAMKAGAKYRAEVPYSGNYDFAPTRMYWRINHMVSPAKDALKCTDCHGKKGRLDWKELGYAGDPMRTKGAARMK